jgi:hypothetical protein
MRNEELRIVGLSALVWRHRVTKCDPASKYLCCVKVASRDRTPQRIQRMQIKFFVSFVKRFVPFVLNGFGVLCDTFCVEWIFLRSAYRRAVNESIYKKVSI